MNVFCAHHFALCCPADQTNDIKSGRTGGLWWSRQHNNNNKLQKMMTNDKRTEKNKYWWNDFGMNVKQINWTKISLFIFISLHFSMHTHTHTHEDWIYFCTKWIHCPIIRKYGQKHTHNRRNKKQTKTLLKVRK